MCRHEVATDEGGFRSGPTHPHPPLANARGTHSSEPEKESVPCLRAHPQMWVMAVARGSITTSCAERPRRQADIEAHAGARQAAGDRHRRCSIGSASRRRLVKASAPTAMMFIRIHALDAEVSRGPAPSSWATVSEIAFSISRTPPSVQTRGASTASSPCRGLQTDIASGRRKGRCAIRRGGRAWRAAVPKRHHRYNEEDPPSAAIVVLSCRPGCGSKLYM